MKLKSYNFIIIIEILIELDFNAIIITLINGAETEYMSWVSYYQNLKTSLLYKVFYFGSKVFICMYRNWMMIIIANINGGLIKYQTTQALQFLLTHITIYEVILIIICILQISN